MSKSLTWLLDMSKTGFSHNQGMFSLCGLSIVVMPQGTQCSAWWGGLNGQSSPSSWALMGQGKVLPPHLPSPLGLGRGPPALSLQLPCVLPHAQSLAFLTTSHHVTCSVLLTPALGPCIRHRSIRASAYRGPWQMLGSAAAQVYRETLFTVVDAQCRKE